MKRSKELQQKRKTFVDKHIYEGLSSGKQIKEVVLELQETLFLSERTIYNIHCSKLK